MVSKKRKAGFAIGTGAMIGFLYAGGYYLDRFDSLDFFQLEFYRRWLLYTIIAGIILYVLWEIIAGQNGKEKENKKIVCAWPFCMCILIFCWLPAWFSVFPGAFSYDANEEWRMVRDGTLTAHHPVSHVLLLGNFVEGFYKLTGNYNVGIGVYTALQMLFLAYVFTEVLRFMKEMGAPAAMQIAALAFYALSPVIQLFSICATKDVLFSAVELLLFMQILRFFFQKEECFYNKRKLIGLGILLFFTMISRNNGFYIVLAMIPVFLIAFWKYRKKILLLFGTVLVLYGIYTGPFYTILGVEDANVREMLSVPIQQMARTYRYDREQLNAEDIELLYQFVPQEALEAYTPTVSDPVKNHISQEMFKAHKKEFFLLWLRWGIKHPLTYINAFLVNTVDFWYPNAVVDGYRNKGEKSSYFDLMVDAPGKEIVLTGGFRQYYEAISWEKSAQRQPFAFLFLSPGWYLVLFLFAGMYLWCYRIYDRLIPLSVVLFNFLTVLLGPMALVRYVLILYLIFPLLPAMLCCRENKNPLDFFVENKKKN